MSYPDPTTDIQFEPDQYDPVNVEGSDSVERIVDYDMSAVDVSDWTVGANATLTKESNGEGGQCLRVAHNGTTDPYATQTITLTGGIEYTFAVRVRTDGSNPAFVQVESGEEHIIYGSDWQWVKWDSVHSSTGFEIGCKTSTGGYAEFDVCSLKWTERRFLDDSGNGNDFIFGLGAGQQASTLPQAVAGKGLIHEVGDLTSMIEDPFSDGVDQFEIVHLLKNPAISSTLQISRSVGTNVIYILRVGVNLLQFYCGSGSGANAATYTGTYNYSNNLMLVRMVHTGSATELYLNGDLVATAGTPLTPTLDTPTPQYARFGAAGSTAEYHGTYLAARYFMGMNLTAAQRLESDRDTLRRYSYHYV